MNETQPQIIVYVFIATGACACNHAGFMDRLFKMLLNFKKWVKMEVKDIESKEATEMKVRGQMMVIKNPPKSEGKDILRFTSVGNLKKYLEFVYFMHD